MSKDSIQAVFRHRLANGLTVLVKSVHTVPKVCVQLWYGVGSKDEGSGERGLAHLLEHMLFKGTNKLSEMDFVAIAHKLSGSSNAFTSYDYTGYQFDFPTQHWVVALDLLADTMRNCTLKQDLLNAEMKAVIQELKLYRDDYASTLEEELISTVFSDHPYHYPIIGFKHDLWNMSSETLMNFYHKHYVPNNATLVVVGDVTPEQVVQEAEKWFGDIEADTTYKHKEYYYKKELGKRSVTLHRDLQQPLACTAFVIPGARERKGYDLDIITWLLANGRGSRLYKKLVDELQLANDVYAYRADLFEHDLLYVMYEPRSLDDRQRIEDIIRAEIASLATDAPSDQELMRARKKAEVDYLGLFENMERYTYALGSSFLATGDEHALTHYIPQDESGLVSRIQMLLREYCRPAIMHTGAVVPLAESDNEVWDRLQQESDEEDEKILQAKQRTSSLEPVNYALRVARKSALPFVFPQGERTVLRNGATLVVHNNEDVQKIDIVVEFAPPTCIDPKLKQGLGLFVSTMLVEGTKDYTREHLIDEIESRGMALTTSPGKIFMSMLSADFEHGVHILHQLLDHATFPANAIEKVREQMLADVRQFWDEPFDFVELLARQELYRDHPASQSAFGTLDSLALITRDDLIEYYDSCMTPKGTIIACVGDIGSRNAAAVFEKELGAWQGPEVPRYQFPELQPVAPTVINHPINRDQVALCFAAPSVRRMDPSYDALLIFDQILAGGMLGSMYSRLFQIREETGLFYTISGSVVKGASHEPGMVLIKTLVSPDRLQEAEKVIRATVDAAVETVSEQEFEQARDALVNTLAYLFESNVQIAYALLFVERYDVPKNYFALRMQHLSSFTLEQMRVAVKEHVRSDQFITVRAGRSSAISVDG